jgi:hypothetical protein
MTTKKKTITTRKGMTTIGKRDRRTQGGQSLGRGWRNSKRTITKKKTITTKGDEQDQEEGDRAQGGRRRIITRKMNCSRK